MLKMIQCDQFICNDQVQEPIVFKRGLNTVLGDEFGSNSIGKTTFLMILDFVFGGDDYVRRSTDVQENIGPHIIKFSFEFEDGTYYFSRATDSWMTIKVCNSQFEACKSISKDEYTKFLSKKWGLNLPDLSFRNAISRFIRVYGRETLDPKQPLQNAMKEPQRFGIDALLKLFNRYEAVKDQKEKAEEAELKEKMFKGAQKYKYLPSVSNKVQYAENEKKIDKLKREIKRLIKDNDQGIIEIDTLQTEDLAELLPLIKAEKRHYIALTNELNSMEIRPIRRYTFQKDCDKLQQFFPEISMKKLKDIEHFHEKIDTILKDELKESSATLQSLINLSAKRIANLKMRLSEVESSPNVTHAILNRHSQKQKELDQLQDANNSYDTQESLKRETKELKLLLGNLISEVISHTETDINAIMGHFSKLVNEKRKPPHFRIKDANRYNFSTPNDRGTGSQYKGLILFDLTILNITNLPLLVHDSVILKQIEDSALEEILNLYAASEKQIFIALDKKESFSKKAQAILQKTCVLQLAPNEHSLFGKVWNQVR